MPMKTKNRTTSRTTRLSTRAERFHWKIKEARKNSTRQTPRIGKIYRMLSRDAGVEGRGALLTYSISVSSGSIKEPFYPATKWRTIGGIAIQSKRVKTKPEALLGYPGE